MIKRGKLELQQLYDGKVNKYSWKGLVQSFATYPYAFPFTFTFNMPSIKTQPYLRTNIQRFNSQTMASCTILYGKYLFEFIQALLSEADKVWRFGIEKMLQ